MQLDRGTTVPYIGTGAAAAHPRCLGTRARREQEKHSSEEVGFAH
jgi:hypothetical protein